MVTELFMSGNSLLPQQQWEEQVKRLRSRTTEEQQQEKSGKEWVGKENIRQNRNKIEGELNAKTSAKIADEIAKKIAHIFQKAVLSRLSEKSCILLSGGVDSSAIALVASRVNADIPCVAIGLKGSPDAEAAQKAAELMRLNLREHIVTLDELEQVIPKVISTIKSVDVTKVSVGAVVWIGLEQAKKSGKSEKPECNNVLCGLGSEEIFAGYKRHRDALNSTQSFDSVHEECWRGLIGMWERDLTRDAAICSALQVSALTPFLDEELIVASMTAPANLKLNESHSKVLFRMAAEQLGLPAEICWRKKHAAQYGSRILDGIEKIAKRRGFKLKKDYLNHVAKGLNEN